MRKTVSIIDTIASEPHPASKLGVQPYIPLRLEVGEQDFRAKLYWLLGEHPGAYLMVGIDTNDGSLATVVIERVGRLEADAELVRRWSRLDRTPAIPILDRSPWADLRRPYLPDPARVRMVLSDRDLFVILVDPCEPAARIGMETWELLADAQGRVIGLVFPGLSTEMLSGIQREAEPPA